MINILKVRYEAAERTLIPKSNNLLGNCLCDLRRLVQLSIPLPIFMMITIITTTTVITLTE